MVLWGKELLIWGKETAKISHRDSEDGWMVAGGAGDSSPLFCVQGWKLKVKQYCPDPLRERKRNRQKGRGGDQEDQLLWEKCKGEQGPE